MSLVRSENWQTCEFHDFLLERSSKPFEWGSNDCASFSADGILAIAGVDIMADLRGYTSGSGAAQKIKDVTKGTTLEDGVVWCAEKHSMQERSHPLLAGRGDLVLYENADGTLAAGLVHLNGRDVVSPGDSGLLRMPLTSVRRAWTY